MNSPGCTRSGEPCAQVFLASSGLACSLLYFRSLSSRASCSGTGSSFVSDRSSCMARGRPHLPYSRVSKLSQALLNAGPVVDSRYIDLFYFKSYIISLRETLIETGVDPVILGVRDYCFGSCVYIYKLLSSTLLPLWPCSRIIIVKLPFLPLFIFTVPSRQTPLAQQPL